jgi:hypothetical protein
MSVQNFNRWFTNPIINKLEQEQRASIESKLGQLLLLDDIGAFDQALKVLYGRQFSDTVAQRALEAGQKKARELEKAFAKVHRQKYLQMLRKIPEVPELSKYIHGISLFLVTNFRDSIPAIKKAILASLEASGELTSEERTQVSRQVHRGHGATGLAVSQVEVASGMNVLGNKLGSNNIEDVVPLLSNLVTGGIMRYSDYMILDMLRVKYSQVVTKKGELRADYISVISFQQAEHNRDADGQIEQRVKAVFKKFIRGIKPSDILEQEGSSTLKEKVGKQVLDSLTPKGAKVRSALKGKELTSTGETSKTIKNEKGPKPSFNKYRSAVSGRFIKKKEGLESYLKIRDLINTLLPETVARNMGVPKLVYRTGRFAGSTKVLSVTPTQGSPMINYTYQRSPYQVFEMQKGADPWRTPDRDPRKILEESIREITYELALGRFNLRRL